MVAPLGNANPIIKTRELFRLHIRTTIFRNSKRRWCGQSALQCAPRLPLIARSSVGRIPSRNGFFFPLPILPVQHKWRRRRRALSRRWWRPLCGLARQRCVPAARRWGARREIKRDNLVAACRAALRNSAEGDSGRMNKAGLCRARAGTLALVRQHDPATTVEAPNSTRTKCMLDTSEDATPPFSRRFVGQHFLGVFSVVFLWTGARFLHCNGRVGRGRLHRPRTAGVIGVRRE